LTAAGVVDVHPVVTLLPLAGLLLAPLFRVSHVL